MNILISTFGVRGDVQPYLALAVGLQAALGEKIRAEDGAAWVAESVERQVGTRTREGARRHETTTTAPSSMPVSKPLPALMSSWS